MLLADWPVCIRGRCLAKGQYENKHASRKVEIVDLSNEYKVILRGFCILGKSPGNTGGLLSGSLIE